MTESCDPVRQFGGITGVHPEKHTHRCVMVGRGCSKTPSQHEWKQGRRYRTHHKIFLILSHCYARYPLTKQKPPWEAKCNWLVCLSSLWEKLCLAECRTTVAFSFRIQRESLQSSQERVNFFVPLSTQLLYWMRARERATCTCSQIKVPSSESDRYVARQAIVQGTFYYC